MQERGRSMVGVDGTAASRHVAWSGDAANAPPRLQEDNNVDDPPDCEFTRQQWDSEYL